MPVTLDLTDDFAVVDNLETVTLTAQDTTTQSVASSFSTPLRTREIEASDGKYTAGDRRFHLPTDNVTGLPEVGGTITDADYTYTILDVERAVMSGIWKLASRKLAIFSDITTLVTIQSATWSKDANGVQVATWVTEASGVRARIQATSENVGTDEKSRGIERRFTVIFAYDQTLDHNRRIVGPDGKTYRVLSYSRRERIDALPMALVELLRS